MSEFLLQVLNQSPVVQGGLTLMIVGWLGYQLRELPGRAVGWVRHWTTRVIEIRDDHPLYDIWLTMLTEHAVRREGPRTLEVRRCRGEDGETSRQSAFGAGAANFWARLMDRWCHVRIFREHGSVGSSMNARFIIHVEVILGRRTHLARMMAEAERRANVMELRQLVDVYDRHAFASTLVLPKRDPDTLCLPRGLFDSIEARLRDFGSARDQYERCGIPWRFGVLLSGEPGTGKTSIAHALASRLSLRLAVINLADLHTDQELVGIFRSIHERAIVLIEDVDCAFRQRQGAGDHTLSFSGFLNCIDGMLAPHNGRILVMSTNHVDRLDPALIRPGRIDLHVEAPLLDRQVATDYADRVFPHVPARHDIVAETMSLARPTPAILINRLMEHRWPKLPIRPSPAPMPTSR